MNNLTLVEKSGVWYADSRDVAEMVDKRHADLLETIKGYIEHLLNGNFRSADFFNPSTYQDSTGRTLLRYDITRRGCDMVANKMTGEKGVLFTAAYVTKFEEMEKQITKPPFESLSPQLQVLIGMEIKQKEFEIKQKQLEDKQTIQDQHIQTIKDTIVNRDENWRKWVDDSIKKIGFARGNYAACYAEARNESYEMLKDRGHCNIETQLSHLKERLKEAGATQTKINLANKIDVIESDPKLKEIYTGIIKEMFIKYVA